MRTGRLLGVAIVAASLALYWRYMQDRANELGSKDRPRRAGVDRGAETEPPTAAEEEARYASLRERMVRDQIEARGVKASWVLKAMREVPRHKFVPVEQRAHAYDDTPLPIGLGQTISQPYIVAYMTELLELTGKEKVLEIGTGSGYQAAVLAELSGEVYTIEILGELAAQADERLKRLGYGGVHVRHGDGYEGWREHAPFDSILVTAAAESPPPALIDQLKPGGRMVIPVGGREAEQVLHVLRKRADGRVDTQKVLPVRFVPLVRGR